MKLDYKLTNPVTVTDATDRRAHLACLRAKEFEEAGEFERARAELGELWGRIGEPPVVDGLSPVTKAEVILRAGTLSGWIGSAQQVPGAQETAKDLISEASRLFEENGLAERVAESQVDLAICYWREGAFDEARVTLDDALHRLEGIESEQRLRAFLNKAIVEKVSHRYEDALRIHRSAAPYFQSSNNHALKGKFHNEFASVLKNVGLSRNRMDLIDQALVEYSAAGFHAEQAGNKRFLALVENNVGLLFERLRRFDEAHTHLDRARTLFQTLKDKGMVAQVDDTRARAFIAQGLTAKAETLARSSVKALAQGDEASLLAEALTTHGTALARLGNFSKSHAAFTKAIRTAHDADVPESGGVAALSMIEELWKQLPFSQLLRNYFVAESELQDSQLPDIQGRLGECARALIRSESFPTDRLVEATTKGTNATSESPADATADVETNSARLSLEEQVLDYEGRLIRHALESSDGSVTRAARSLGITHQGLAFILNGRHKDLLAARKPVKRRRRSIIRFH
jgi:tetratricopeptide (TPR) repeat protein